MPTTTSLLMTATLAAGIVAAAFFAALYVGGGLAGKSAASLAPTARSVAEACVNRTERYELSSQPPFYLTQRCSRSTVAR